MTFVSVVDAGIGNFMAVNNMLRRVGVSSRVASNPNELDESTHIILPGVGSFDGAMERLNDGDWTQELSLFVSERRGTLVGICLGAQLLGKTSEEGELEGLGFIDFDVRRIQTSGLPLPHMGWNTVQPVGPAQEFTNLFESSKYYFAHSYAIPVDPSFTAGTTTHGQQFSSVVKSERIWGFQFHPEKSHSYGMRLLKDVFDAT
jgi:imidazole glycerol-phosphate synthase subunit HisH